MVIFIIINNFSLVCLFNLHALIYPLYFIYVVGILHQATDDSQHVFEIMAEVLHNKSKIIASFDGDTNIRDDAN